MNRKKKLFLAMWLSLLLGLGAKGWSQAPDGSLEEAKALDSKAKELYEAGRFQAALPLCERMLQIREKVLGAKHPDTVTNMGNLAALHYQMGAYDKALPLYERALETHEKVFGPDHPQTVTILSNLAQLHMVMGSYEKALPLFERVYEIGEKVLTPAPPDVLAKRLENLAFMYSAIGRHDKALPLYERALAINEKAFGSNHPSTAHSLNELGGCHRAMGTHDRALPLIQRALEISETGLGPDHSSTAECLNNLAELYRDMGSYDKALTLQERVLGIREKVLGQGHPKTAESLNKLGAVYHAMGSNDKALPLQERALAINEKVLGPEHPSTSVILHNLAELYRSMGSYAKALPLCERALEIREKSLGPEHPDTAASLNNLAGLHRSMGSYAKALPLCERALEIREKSLGPEHPDTATSLNNLAVLRENMGSYHKALPLYERALAINEKVLGPEHPSTATSLLNLANIHQSMGSYAKALPLCERALEIREKSLGPEHPDTAMNLNNLAGLHQNIGSYEKALPLYERALAINEKVLGPEHPSTSVILHNLAELYRSMGSYAKALPLCERALEIREKSLGPEHPDTAASLNNLAEMYKAIGALTKALLLFERALGIHEKTLGSDHPNTATSLHNLANIHISMGSYHKALPLYQQALRIYQTFDPEHPHTAASLNNLAEVYKVMGLYNKALPLYEQALRINEKALGPEHPNTASVLANMGSTYLRLKDYPSAEKAIKMSKNGAALVDLYLSIGKSEEALTLLRVAEPDVMSTPADQIQIRTLEGMALSATGHRPDAAESLFKAVKEIEHLRSQLTGERGGFFQAGTGGGYMRAYRGLVATLAESSRHGDKLPDVFKAYGDNPAEAGFYFAEATKARSLLEAMAEAARKKTRVEIPEDLKEREEGLLQQLSSITEQWEKALKGGKESLEEVKSRKERLTNELDSLIAELRHSYPAYAALHHPRPIPAKELPLKSHELLLEYAVGYKTSTIFLVRKGGVEKVIDIPVGKEAMEEKVKAFMEPLLNNRGKGFSPVVAKELYGLLLAKALEGVKETDEVIIVPDGILGLLPFEALVVKEGYGLADAIYVGDRYTLRYYQSAAVLALQRTLKDQEASRPLFALGNPVFNATDERCAASKPKKKSEGTTAKKETQIAFRALATRVEWGKTNAGDKDETELVYLPLPETETEVRSIAQLMGVSAKPPDVLLNLNASESRLRGTNLRDYRYVHFATHADLPGKVQGVNEPFLLLGQVGNRGDDNGFLTMSKVLGLELRADMVVLSACLTGRGKVMEGEGVVNFARAFQHAGAKSVVVSLWEVASQATVDYMERFYGYLKAGKTRAEALRQARSEMKAQYPNPFLWAPFILHGEG